LGVPAGGDILTENQISANCRLIEYMQNRKNTDMLWKPINSMKAGEIYKLTKTKLEKITNYFLTRLN
jgi:hypothetical protein